MGTPQVDVWQPPTWTRGPARIKGDEIVLDRKRAKPYALFEEPPGQLLIDMAKLHSLGSIVNRRVINKRPMNRRYAEDFAQRHGLLWHQPNEDSGSCRESWRSWLLTGHELSVSIALYTKLSEAMATGSVESLESLKSFLRGYRDLGNAFGSMPEPDEKLLEHISILLADRVTKGLEGCTPTIIAACSLKRGGKKAGPAGEFFACIRPSNLVTVAYNEFVTLVESKALFRECPGCGNFWRWKPGVHHRDRAYCEDPGCYDRTRKRKQRAKKSK